MRAVFVALALLIPAVAAAQNERENLYSTRAIRTFGLALTAGGEFGVPRYTTTLRPTCGTANLGAIIRNTTTNTFQGCDGSSWASLGVAFGGASGGTATRVLFTDGSGNLADDADMTFSTNTLSITKIDAGDIQVRSTGSGTPIHFEVPALSALTGADNICVGTGSCAAMTTGSQNIVMGTNAADGATTTMTNSVCVGYQACSGSTLGASNTAVGHGALDTTTSASTNNVAVGTSALGNFLGTGSGSNTSLGSASCVSISTGSSNVCIGTSANGIAAGNAQIAIGAGATTTASNQMVVGGDGTQITDVYWGESVTNATPLDVTHNATGASGTDTAGGGYRTAGGKGTGTGAPGEWVAQTSVPTTTGTTLQTLASRLWIEGSQKTLTAGAATAVVRIAVAQGSVTGGVFEYVVRADDGTDFQARAGRLNWQVVNKTGTETCVVGDGTATEAEDGSSIAQSSASTLTYSVTCTSNAADTVDLEINAASGLSETTLRVEQWKLTKHGGVGAITPQ